MGLFLRQWRHGITVDALIKNADMLSGIIETSGEPVGPALIESLIDAIRDGVADGDQRAG